MDNNKKILIESTLFKAVISFHDIDDETQREQFLKEYFEEFCTKLDVDPTEACSLIEEMIERTRENSDFKYEHYKDDGLRKVLLGTESQKTAIDKKSVEDETPEI